jgi:hypothetical protein
LRPSGAFAGRMSWGASFRVAARPWFLGGLALLVAFALRVHNLGVKDLWWDEAHSWSFAVEPLLAGMRDGLHLLNDPLYIILLHVWARLVGHSEFALRFFSTLMSVLTVAYLGRVATRAFGRATGRAALALGALSPIWLFYAQEVRQYALLPFLTLAMLESLVGVERGSGDRSAWTWVRLAAAEGLGLYAHSFMFFVAAGINCVLAFAVLRRRERIGRWIASQATVLIAIAPIIPFYLGRGLSGGLQETSLGAGQLINAVWHFWMGITWEALPLPSTMKVLSALTLALTGAGLAANLRGGSTHNRLAADFFWTVALGSGLTLIFWQFNSKIHPRYLLMLSAPLYGLLAWLLVEGWRRGGVRRALAVGLGVATLATFGLGVERVYAGTTGYRHDPTRAVAAYVRQASGPGDGVITVDPYDYTLTYYGIGPAPLFRAGLDEGLHDEADLADFIRGKERVAVVRFHAEASDRRRIIPFYLERFGRYQRTQAFEAYEVHLYKVDPGAVAAPAVFEPCLVDWGDLRLTDVSLEAEDALTLALRWAGWPKDGRRYAAIARLVDPETGWQVGRASGLIFDRRGRPSDAWAGTTETEQYLVIPLAPGTPPLDVDVEVSLIDADTGQAFDARSQTGAPAGQWMAIGAARLGPVADDPYGARQALGLGPVDSGAISAYALDWPTVAPGGTLGLTIEWTLPQADLLASPPSIKLVQGSKVIASDEGPPLQGRPLAEVPDGAPYLDHRVLQVSREAEPGQAEIVVMLDAGALTLGQVEVIGFERTFEPPEVPHRLEADFEGAFRLLGYDISPAGQIANTGTLRLTLYWQALADGTPEADYTVFTHILAEDGRLIGQHDGPPVSGTRPTSGWLAGEYLVDEHTLTFKEAYTGPAVVQIGLYDPRTFRRALTDDGSDAVRLPVELEVVSERQLP